ncbi:hypothetical protein CH338_15575, partial [Rhodoplanes elegans]
MARPIGAVAVRAAALTPARLPVALATVAPPIVALLATLRTVAPIAAMVATAAAIGPIAARFGALRRRHGLAVR